MSFLVSDENFNSLPIELRSQAFTPVFYYDHLPVKSVEPKEAAAIVLENNENSWIGDLDIYLKDKYIVDNIIILFEDYEKRITDFSITSNGITLFQGSAAPYENTFTLTPMLTDHLQIKVKGYRIDNNSYLDQGITRFISVGGYSPLPVLDGEQEPMPQLDRQPVLNPATIYGYSAIYDMGMLNLKDNDVNNLLKEEENKAWVAKGAGSYVAQEFDDNADISSISLGFLQQPPRSYTIFIRVYNKRGLKGPADLDVETTVYQRYFKVQSGIEFMDIPLSIPQNIEKTVVVGCFETNSPKGWFTLTKFTCNRL